MLGHDGTLTVHVHAFYKNGIAQPIGHHELHQLVNAQVFFSASFVQVA